MVLARVQDWASSAAVPFDGRPQGGGHLESTARVRAEGALDLSIRWAPVPSLEPITLRSNRPSAAAVRLDRSWTLMFRCHDNARALSARYISRSEPQVWTSERRVGALSGTLSCFAVTRERAESTESRDYTPPRRPTPRCLTSPSPSSAFRPNKSLTRPNHWCRWCFPSTHQW